MEERYFITCTKRALLFAAIAHALGSYSAHAQVPENLPPAIGQPSSEIRSERNSVRDPNCPTLENKPLSALTVDIRPYDEESGDLVAEDDTPPGCAPGPGPAVPFFLDYGSPYAWSCHDLLQLARFCHPRLYFEDVRVERYGYEPCCQGLHSAAEFTCDLFFLPARLLINKRQPCVRTPTPHCWSGSSVCAF